MTFADVFPFCFQFKRLWLPLRRIRLWLRRLLWRLLRRLLRTASYATGSCPCSCPSPRQYVLKCGFFHCHTLGPAFSHFFYFTILDCGKMYGGKMSPTPGTQSNTLVLFLSVQRKISRLSPIVSHFLLYFDVRYRLRRIGQDVRKPSCLRSRSPI